MNYLKKNNFFHGVMFHHFHDNKTHQKGQGSINKDELVKLINFVGRKNIVNAEEFMEKYKKKKLKNNHICFTFDDGLKCQYDIALPVLEDFGIKSFFFINTCNYTNKPLMLEVYRSFRHKCYIDIDDFYDEFFFSIKNYDLKKIFKSREKFIKFEKKRYPFYSLNDIKFRILRDFYLKNKKYNQIMLQLIKKKKFNFKKELKNIYMSEKDIKRLAKLKHHVGLHSHTHPYVISDLSKKKQIYEYSKNNKILEKLTGKKIKSMAHPCNSYSGPIIRYLKELKIDIGFLSNTTKSNKTKKINNSQFEIVREDHSKIIDKI